MLVIRKQWEKYKKASTTIWGTNWLYMSKWQGAANKEDWNKTTLIHIAHKSTIYKTWGINYNIRSLWRH